MMALGQRTPLEFWLKAVAVAGLYLLLAKLGLNYALVNGNVTVLWLPGGLALAVMLVWGSRYWPAIFAGAFAAGVMVGDTVWMSLLIAAGNTLEPLCGAWLLNRNARFDLSLQHASDFYRLLFLAGVLSAGLSAVPGGLVLLGAGYIQWEQFPTVVLQWWMGDALGIVLVAPLCLVWRQWPSGWLKSGRLPELFLLFGLAFLVGQMVFLGWFAQWAGRYALPFWMFPFLILAALRFGRHGASLMLVLIFSQRLWGTSHSMFPEQLEHSGLVNFWLFNMMHVITGMTLATYHHELRQTARRLQDSETRFRLIAERAQDILWTMDLSGRFTYLSPAAEKLRGMPLERAMEQPFQDKLTPQSAQLMGDELGKIIKSNGRYCPPLLEMEMQSLDGSRKWVEAAVSPIHDESGQLASLVGVTRDITQRRKYEEESNILHAAIAASLNEIYLFDAVTLKFVFVNLGALKNLGYAMEEMRELTPLDLKISFTQEHFKTLIGPLLQREVAIQHFETEHKRKDGSSYPVEVHLQLFERGDTRLFMAVIIDITERRQNEQVLRESEAQFRLITERAHDVLWKINTNGEFTYISPSVEKLRGYSVEEAMAQPIEERMTPASAEYVRGEFGKIVESNGRYHPDSMEMELLCKDGSAVWTEVSIGPVFDDYGRLISMIGVTRDISRRKAAEDRLQQLNQELDLRVREEVEKGRQKDILLQQQSRLAGMGEMMGNIAHQWRQPINSLGLILQDLEDAFLNGAVDKSYLRESVEKSLAIIQRMSHTIDDFRNFFRIDKSAVMFGLKEAGTECLSLVDAAMDHAGIEIVTVIEQDAKVWGYPGEFQQALMNLLMNARDAIVERGVVDGRIELRVGVGDGMGFVAVTDNGGGIPEEIIGKVFDPYFTTKKQGVGIGLYMSRVAVVDHMHGRLLMQNSGLGAQFSIYLPMGKHKKGKA